MSDRKSCIDALGVIAAMHNFNLTPAIVQFYVMEFERVGYPKAYQILTHLVRHCRKFPTIADFVDASGDKPPEEKDEATALAMLIWNRISKGDDKRALEETKQLVGELGWHVIEVLGGMTQLCNTMMDDDRGTFIAQTRDAIKGMRHKFENQKSLSNGGFDAVKFIEGVNNGK